MLTIEVKLNGKLIAGANLVACGDIVNDGVTVTDDYALRWIEDQGEGLAATRNADRFVIRGHRRGMSAWALVAKAVVAILGQLADRQEEKPGQARVWDQAGRDHK